MYPQFDYVEDKWLAKKVYNKLSLRYIFAISTIAIMIISNQVIAHQLMKRQLNDSRIINIAGRQRMLSQKLTKDFLLFQRESNIFKRDQYLRNIDSAFSLWCTSHFGLQFGDSVAGLPGSNSKEIKHLFEKIKPHFDAIQYSYSEIKKYNISQSVGIQNITPEIDAILLHEPQFLEIMNQIVFQYDKEAKERVSSLIKIESILLYIGLAVLLFEVLFIFLPTAIYSKTIVNELIESEEKQKNLQDKLLNKKKEEQKILTTMFFEGQERERRRIVRDLHDGIGQLLTGLKFQIEAIDTKNTANISSQVGDIKDAAGDIIKEIRRVSFDLRPTVLSDYGLVAAIRNITSALDKLSSTDIEFCNSSNFDLRFEKKLETHIFRIVQEAINNALKYAKAKNIIVEISHDAQNLTLIVKDNGIGFNFEQVRREDYEKRKGHGLFNMKERSEFIQAQFNIATKPGKGTKIILILPLNNTERQEKTT